MRTDSSRFALGVCGAVAAVLQLLLAPALAIGGAVPSFILAAVAAVVVVDPDERHYVFAFVMGLLSDLLGSAPVGSTAVALLLVAWILPVLVEAIGNDNVPMTLLSLFAGLLAAQVTIGLLLSLSGVVGFLDFLWGGALPRAVYDAVLALAFALVAARLRSGRGMNGGATMSNIRFN